VTRAVGARGKIHSYRDALWRQGRTSLCEFLRWSTADIITRVYASHLWKLGLAAYIFYCGTFHPGLAALTLPGTPPASVFPWRLRYSLFCLLGQPKAYSHCVHERFSPKRLAAAVPVIGCYPAGSVDMLGISLWLVSHANRMAGTEYETGFSDEVA